MPGLGKSPGITASEAAFHFTNQPVCPFLALADAKRKFFFFADLLCKQQRVVYFAATDKYKSPCSNFGFFPELTNAVVTSDHGAFDCVSHEADSTNPTSFP